MAGPSDSSACAQLVDEARDLAVVALVYVPAPDDRTDAVGRPPVRIIDGAAAAAAESAGHTWFRAPHPRPAAGPDRNGSVLVPLRTNGSDVHGVVVAAPGEALTWTVAQRAEIRRVVESHAGDIERHAQNGNGSIPPPGKRSRAGENTPSRIEDDIAADLRDAVERDELCLAYQPEIDLPTGKIVAVEALVRWRHPQLGELGPEWFISLAERSDLIILVGDWVLSRSVAALASWNAALPGLDLLLRVNVSPVQLEAGGLLASVSGALEQHGVPGRQLCIELTENVPLGDVDDAARSINRLKELGVSSAIDDLATGYSALSRLRALPVDDVKIDRSLVSGIDSDPRAQTIMVALIGLALNIGLGIIAEGVETAAEATTLLELGCIRAQGHHLGRPIDADAMLRLLAEQQSHGTDTDVSHVL